MIGSLSVSTIKSNAIFSSKSSQPVMVKSSLAAIKRSDRSINFKLNAHKRDLASPTTNPVMMAKLDSRPDLQEKISWLAESREANPHNAKIVAGLLSGGVDTSFIPLILSKFFDVEVKSLTLNFGSIAGDGIAQDAENITSNLKGFGVSDAQFSDMRDELGETFKPLLMGDVTVPGSNGVFPNSSLSRVLMVRELAKKFPEADVYLTGSAANQNNNLRFMTAAQRHLDAPLWSPIFSWEKGDESVPGITRQDCLDIIKLVTGNDLSSRAGKDDPSTSGDETFLKNEEEDGSRSILSYDFEVDLSDSPKEPRKISLEFNKGSPVAINGHSLSFVEIIGRLNQLGLEYKIPWNCSIESRPTGFGEPEWNLTPGVTAVREASLRMRAASVPPSNIREMEKIKTDLAESIIRGGLENPATQSKLSMIENLCSNMTGKVDLTFYPGFTRASRPSPNNPITVHEANNGKMTPPEKPMDSVRALITDNVVSQSNI